MSLEFIVIPALQMFESNVHTFINKVKNSVDKNIEFIIDTNYNSKLNSRIAKYKKQNMDIIIIDDDYSETNIITIRFFNEGYKNSNIFIDDFIELIFSLEYDEASDEASDEDDLTNDKTNNENNKEKSIDDKSTNEKGKEDSSFECLVM